MWSVTPIRHAIGPLSAPVALRLLAGAGCSNADLVSADSRRELLFRALFRRTIVATDALGRCSNAMHTRCWGYDAPAANATSLVARVDRYAEATIAATAARPRLRVPAQPPQPLVRSRYEEGCPTTWSRSILMDPAALGFVLDSNASAQVFIDRTLAFCFLCNEPVSNASTHSGYWEHVSRFVALRLSSAYRRRWAPEGVLVEAAACLLLQPTTLLRMVPGWLLSRWTLPRLKTLLLPIACDDESNARSASVALMTHDATSSTDPSPLSGTPISNPKHKRNSSVVDRRRTAAHSGAAGRMCGYRALERLTRRLSTPGSFPPPSVAPALGDAEAALRRDALTALLLRLCTWRVLDYAFVCEEERPGAINQGERSFRATMSDLMTPMMPPMSAQAMTRWHQKCYGRQTLEILFDVLHIDALFQRALFHVDAVADTKEKKAAVMRQLLYQLHCAVDMCGVPATRAAAAAAVGAPSTLQQRYGAAVAANQGAAPPPPPCVLAMLCEMALRRIAFELVHIRTSILMDETAGGMWGTLGFPTAPDVEGSSLAN